MTNDTLDKIDRLLVALGVAINEGGIPGSYGSIPPALSDLRDAIKVEVAVNDARAQAELQALWRRRGPVVVSPVVTIEAEVVPAAPDATKGNEL